MTSRTVYEIICSMNGTREVAVVGGGIAGTTIALELARRGRTVQLYEQATLGAGASGRNTGTLLHQSEPAVTAMLRASVASYSDLLDGAIEFRLTERDQLLIARHEAHLERTERRARAIADHGVAVERLTGPELRARLAWLDAGVAGGYLLAGAYTIETEAATRAFAEAAREAGATITTGVRVAAVAPGGLVTDHGRVTADAVVVATGPWLADLLEGAPVRAGRGWLMRTSRLPFELPCIVEEDSWPDQWVLGRAAEPVTLADLADGYGDRTVARCFLLCPLPDGDALVGATLATSLRDAVEGAGGPRAIAERALEMAPGLARAVAVTRVWSALRPMTPDGLPIVGAWRDGVFVHGGHASLGMQAAPATARWLAADMHDEPTDRTLEELRPDRFAS
jgi:D-hydroxyproline dehydrogenase subunit beta